MRNMTGSMCSTAYVKYYRLGCIEQTKGTATDKDYNSAEFSVIVDGWNLLWKMSY